MPPGLSLLLQLYPPSVNDAFWQQHIRDATHRMDFLQFWPSLYADFVLLQRYGDWRVKLVFLIIYSINLVQMTTLFSAMRQPQHLARRYSPYKRNAFVLTERLLRSWVYILYLDPVMLGDLDIKGVSSAPEPDSAASLWLACKLLILLSGGVAAFWHTIFMALPWSQEVLLALLTTSGSLYHSTRPTAQLIGSWPEHTPLHAVKH